MSTYEDNPAARFAVLAPEPLPGDWADVLSRAGVAREGRKRLGRFAALHGRRRTLVVLAIAVLVVVVGAASAFGVRALFADKGLIGLAPDGATPSTPERGELVLDFVFGHSLGDHGRFSVLVYADGRMIWQRVGDYSRTDEYRDSTGLLERRLTPEGVELVRAEVISTGLVDHDLHLQSGQGLYFGLIAFRTGDRLVHVTWGDIGTPYSDVAREMPTPQQESALIRLDARLEDPASWLPVSAWQDPEIKPYVPSGYSVCYFGGLGVGLSQVLALFPSAAEDLLRSQGIRREQAPSFVYWCSDLTNKEARKLARILDDAGLNGHEDVFGVTYGAYEREPVGPTEFSLTFGPLIPHEGEGGTR